jgi:hypothetical protein
MIVGFSKSIDINFCSKVKKGEGIWGVQGHGTLTGLLNGVVALFLMMASWSSVA